eukprot:COSAG02_NODE_12829_length_1486_cov_1.540014_1_plen_229_part_00
MLYYANYALCSLHVIMPKGNAGIIGLPQSVASVDPVVAFVDPVVAFERIAVAGSSALGQETVDDTTIDGTCVDSLARRINHRVPGNMEFVEDDASPYAQLELIQPVRGGEQLFADYGPTYAYSEHRFARFSGAGPVATSMVVRQGMEVVFFSLNVILPRGLSRSVLNAHRPETDRTPSTCAVVAHTWQPVVLDLVRVSVTGHVELFHASDRTQISSLAQQTAIGLMCE